MRKDQVEKMAWQWAETTPPEAITERHVLTAYILHPPHNRKTACKKNCRPQPLCISGLGEHDWLQGGDITRLCPEPEESGPDLRIEGVPAGLKNLGATCYVNSLLQLWFHNHKFRRAILQWDPIVDPVEQLNETLMTDQYVPITPIGHLQLIFGYLHGTRLRTVDPSPFISSLRLDTMYQQDAQEFSKLFSTLLEEGLSHQSSPAVSGVVQRLMRGQYQYVTRCNHCLQQSTCPSYFYELDLQIQGHKQLSDCLTEFLHEESLTGTNQYNCQLCGTKRDASRAIRLTSLPPVLNFQLMRFVFDRETGLKKKLSSHLRFPELLDMSDYLLQAAETSVYRLQAVLLHKGPSAYSGHYTAHICDSRTGEWFRFNDEEVEKIKTLKLAAEDELDDGTKKPKQTRCPKGYHSSNQAYMLVYSSVAEFGTSGESAGGDDVTLPDHIQPMLDTVNSTVDAELTRNEMAKCASAEVLRCREQEVREIFPRLVCTDVHAGLLLLPTTWLSDWLAGKLPGPIDTSQLCCQHGKLSPWHAAKTKCINPSAGDMLTALYGGAGVNQFGLCWECVRHRCRVIRAKLTLEEDANTVTALLRDDTLMEESLVWVGKATLRTWKRLALATLPQDVPPSMPSAASDNSNPTSPGGDPDTNSSVGCRQPAPPATTNGPTLNGTCEQNGTAEGKEAGSDREEAGPSPSVEEEDEEGEENDEGEEFNGDIRCEHGELCVDEGARRLVPEMVWMILTKYFPDAWRYKSNHQPCPRCMEQVSEEEQLRQFYRQLAVEQRASLSDLYSDRLRPQLPAPGQFHLVSRDSADLWRKFLRDPVKRDPATLESKTLLCPHRGLLFSPESAEDRQRMVFLHEWEWEVVKSSGHDGVQIIVTKSEDPSVPLSVEPALCHDCIRARLEEEHQRRLQYSCTKIFIRKVENLEEEVEEVACKRARLEPDSEPLRRSTRPRRARGEKHVNVASTDTLRDLKVQIMKLFKVAPYDQHLVFNGVPLVDNQATLGHLGIVPGSTVLLKADEVNETVDMTTSEDLTAAADPEIGFKGTGLVSS